MVLIESCLFGNKILSNKITVTAQAYVGTNISMSLTTNNANYVFFSLYKPTKNELNLRLKDKHDTKNGFPQLNNKYYGVL